MRKLFICIFTIFTVQLSVPLQAFAASRPNYPPDKCWDALGKMTMDYADAAKGIKSNLHVSFYQSANGVYWIKPYIDSITSCRKNDFITVVKAYTSKYRTLADYAYYREPGAVILKGDDPNKFRVAVCKQVTKFLTEKNLVIYAEQNLAECQNSKGR